MSNMGYLSLFVVVLIFVQFEASEVKQERATVITCNRDYFVECYGITRRLARGKSYKTNLTAVSRYPSGNNVTLKVVVNNVVNFELVSIKLCELPNVPWVWEYTKSFSNFNGDCPYKPGMYGYYNMELPPKHLPPKYLKMFKGTFHVRFYYVITKIEEIILEFDIIINH